MSTILELQHALHGLSAADLESIADWLETQVQESRYRTYHVREAQPEYGSEEPLFMTWEEHLAFEERSPYRHEYVNGAVHAMRGASLAHNRIAQKLVMGASRVRIRIQRIHLGRFMSAEGQWAQRSSRGAHCRCRIRQSSWGATT